MKRLVVPVLLVALMAFVGMARGDEKSDPAGKWKWKVGRMGQEREVTLSLKREGDKLTGSMPGRGGQEVQIEDGTYKNGKISFTVTRERNGQKFTTKYTGTVSDDTIKGKMEFERNGETQSRDWEAKRAKD
jgi:hypothetical protein